MFEIPESGRELAVKRRIITPVGFTEADSPVAAPGAKQKAVPDIPLASFVGAAPIQQLPLAKLRPSPFNVRRFRSQARILEISESLKTDGQQEPLRVYPGQGEDAGFYMIVSGVTRYQAALALAWPTLDARVDATLDPADIVELVKVSHLHNDSAQETDLDHAVIANELTDRGVTAQRIAVALGYNSPRKVFRLKTFYELPRSIFDLATQYPHRITAVIAETLRNAVEQVGEETALALARECAEENLGKDRLGRRVGVESRKQERNDGQQARAPREISVPVSYGRHRVGRFSVQAIPNSSEKRVQFSASLPAEVADELSRNLDAIIQRLKEQGSPARQE
jgi:ParB/RepB/Spo0J family partition protein